LPNSKAIVRLFIDGIDVTSGVSVTQTGIAYNATLPAGNHTITLVIAVVIVCVFALLIFILANRRKK